MKPTPCCCAIPETSCPPRCAGEIAWTIARGASAEATILVRNVGVATREFRFSATALHGLEVGTASLEIEPASAVLKPFESAVVKVRLKDSLSLRACQDYWAEVLVRGSWEQSIAIRCRILPDPFDSVSLGQGHSLKDRMIDALARKASFTWKIDRGVTPEGALTIHNEGKEAQSFQLEATPLVGAGAGVASVVVSPSLLTLAGGQFGVARLRLENSLSLEPCQLYSSHILMRGFCEQRVEVRCHVAADASAHQTIAQGEAPTSVRAHRWYHHFQCTEPCASGAG